MKIFSKYLQYAFLSTCGLLAFNAPTAVASSDSSRNLELEVASSSGQMSSQMESHGSSSTSSSQADILYLKSLEPLTREREIPVTTGSLIGFSSTGLEGKIIKASCSDSAQGFSHVGLAIVARPSEMLRIVEESINHGGLSTRKKKYHQAQLQDILGYYPQLTQHSTDSQSSREERGVFCFEATGSAQETKRGLKARVKLSPLSAIVTGYKGDVAIRPLENPIPLEDLWPVLVSELGVSYVKILNLGQLVNSAKNKNTHKEDGAWFCSELVMHIYRQFHIVDTHGVFNENVVPFQFESWRPDSDLIKNKAGKEQYVKRYKDTYEKLRARRREAKNRAKGYKIGKYLPFSLSSKPTEKENPRQDDSRSQRSKSSSESDLRI